MSLWQIAWQYLWNRWFTTVLTILSVALAVGLITSILTIRNETRERFLEEQNAFDAVVGGPDSPLQVVLNAIYYMEQPTVPLRYTNYLRIKEMEDVTHAFPVMLGDTYGVQRFRIVGTVPEIFEYPWESNTTRQKRYPYALADGRYFEKPMEAVIGHLVARQSGLEIGSTFTGMHGTVDLGEFNLYSHDDAVYTVVGIMKPSSTSADRAIFVNLESVWSMHDEHGDGDEEHEDPENPAHDEDDDRMISAVLVDLYSSTDRWDFKGRIMEMQFGTVAIPIEEINTFYNQILEPVVMMMKAVGYVVVVISALSIMIGLYLSIIQRRRDLAIMRSLGASRGEIFGAVMIEAFLVTGIGVIVGWGLGKVVALALGAYIAENYGLTIQGISTSTEELQFFGIVMFVGLFAGIVPAWQAYQSDIAEDLQAT